MKIVVANWKMYLGVRESVALARGVLRGLRGMSEVPTVLLAPSFTALTDLGKALGRSRVKMAAQNMNANENGAYTGDVSARSIKEVGASSVILGHSELREHYFESDEVVADKVQLALDSRLDVIVCVGEPAAVRTAGETIPHVQGQIKTVFDGIRVEKRHKVMIAYEPIWAIGTGKVPSIHDAVEVHKAIKKQLEELDIEDVKVLYGGSVTPENAYEFLNNKHVDGVLVGGASAKIKSLLDIINIASEVS